MWEVPLSEPLRRQRFEHMLAVQWVEVELRTKPFGVRFEDKEGGDVHFDMWARRSFKGQGQNRVRLPAFRVCDEQDFLGSNVGVTAVGVHCWGGGGAHISTSRAKYRGRKLLSVTKTPRRRLRAEHHGNNESASMKPRALETGKLSRRRFEAFPETG